MSLTTHAGTKFYAKVRVMSLMTHFGINDSDFFNDANVVDDALRYKQQTLTLFDPLFIVLFFLKDARHLSKFDAFPSTSTSTSTVQYTLLE
jgi:hypothetical protein